MMDSRTTFERRLEMLFFLVRRRKSTVFELAEMFDVHRNTAYRDVVFLSRYAPIYTKIGVNGGIFLMDEYHDNLFIYLTAEEEQVLNGLMNRLNSSERIIVRNILNKYAMPKVSK